MTCAVVHPKFGRCIETGVHGDARRPHRYAIEAYVRQGRCQHGSISDEQIEANEELLKQTWGGTDPLKCPDCEEYLYPHDDGVTKTVYVGEPWGAGRE
jgi:hypothetical protein